MPIANIPVVEALSMSSRLSAMCNESHSALDIERGYMSAFSLPIYRS